tara:strand:- start:1077 stop:1259 length:183 start_codon:yes stop_codon:yes gene_type:complete
VEYTLFARHTKSKTHIFLWVKPPSPTLGAREIESLDSLSAVYDSLKNVSGMLNPHGIQIS